MNLLTTHQTMVMKSLNYWFVWLLDTYLEDHPMTCKYLATMVIGLSPKWGCGTPSKWPFTPWQKQMGVIQTTDPKWVPILLPHVKSVKIKSPQAPDSNGSTRPWSFRRRSNSPQGPRYQFFSFNDELSAGKAATGWHRIWPGTRG